MLNFAPTDEQKEIRDLAHSLAVEQLRVQGRAAEKRGDIAPQLMQTLAQTGLTTPFPEEFGGSGMLEAVTYVLIAEELGFGDNGKAGLITGAAAGIGRVLDHDRADAAVDAGTHAASASRACNPH